MTKMLELNKIYCGDCLEYMREMPDKCVDLTVTSPPYDNLRTYNGYSFNFEETAKELYRITKDGGVVVWVVGDATKNGSETGTSFKQALYFKEVGFNLHDTMIYHKYGLPNETDKRYRQDFEYMFVFSKGTPKTFNPLLHRKKCNDRRKTKNISKSADGVYHESKMNPHAYTKNGNVFLYVSSGGNGQTDDIAYGHPATFPEQLANDHIFSWSNEGDTVFDPFNGSGTTCKMAKINQRNFIGIDISQKYCDIAEKQLERVNNHKITDFFGVQE